MSMRLLRGLALVREHAQPLLRPAEVASLLCIPVATVWRLLAEGKLPGMKLGGSWVISRDALCQQLETMAKGCSHGERSLFDAMRDRLAKSQRLQDRVFDRKTN